MTDAPHAITGSTEAKARKATCGVVAVLIVHGFIAVQIALILNLWHAISYAIVPFVLLNSAFELIRSAPLFAALCMAPPMLALVGIRRVMRAANAQRAPMTKLLIWIVLALWLPILCGEGLRRMLMHPMLSSATLQCRGSVDLFESMQGKLANDGFRSPHAWFIRDRQPWLWSYRSLRFEPAPDWVGVVALPDACRRALDR